MHAKIAKETQERYRSVARENKIREVGSFATGVGTAAIGVYLQVPPEFAGGAVAATVLGVGALVWFNSSRLKEVEKMLLTSEELGASFRRTHSREVGDADEFAASVWQRIRDPLRASLESIGLENFESVGNRDLEELNRILDEEIPRLRRLASPSHFGVSSGGGISDAAN